jgi:aminoglycoside phosphotransferase (APT) family kinase protein
MTLDGQFPDTSTVESCLRAVLRYSKPGAGVLVRVERQPNPYMSSAPSEIAICSFDSGERLQLLLKYDIREPSADYGHWGSVEHEILVYRDILQTLPLPVPTYYGTFIIQATGQRCLVLQWLDGAIRLAKAAEPRTAVTLAAQWLGRFHAAAEARLLEAPIRFLNAYDAQYYAQWARRTLHFAEMLPESHPWLPTLCARFEKASPGLTNGFLTMIHGEFYPHNILIADGVAYPIDWQSAAVARGEVDLASLTEGWGQDVEAWCEEEYLRSRWGGEVPDGFHQALAMARLYWPLRWLGAYRRAISRQRCQRYINSLRIQGERAGLL